MVTTERVGSILGLTAQKTVITRGADTIHETTEHHTDTAEIIHLITGAEAEAEEGVTGLFLEVFLLPRGDITGATLPVSLRLSHGEARGGAARQVGQQALLVFVTVLHQGAIQIVTVAKNGLCRGRRLPGLPLLVKIK